MDEEVSAPTFRNVNICESLMEILQSAVDADKISRSSGLEMRNNRGMQSLSISDQSLLPRLSIPYFDRLQTQ